MQKVAYLDRKGERLVVQGLRHWLSGYEYGDVACWEQAWSLYTEELGAIGAGEVITRLHLFVQSLRANAAEPVQCLTCQCRFLCRSECICVALIAALQHGDGETALLCASSLVSAQVKEVLIKASAYAESLNQHGGRLIAVPASVIAPIIQQAEATRQRLH
jgi:radical SAM protein with 4Fe4S-binding SPASM domain